MVGEPGVGGGEAAVRRLLEEAPETTGVIAYNDLMAIGAMRAVQASGRTVPDDISVVGFDDIAIAAYADLPLTTIAQSIGALGRWAVERLVERIADSGSVPAAMHRHARRSRDRPAGATRDPRLQRARLAGAGLAPRIVLPSVDVRGLRPEFGGLRRTDGSHGVWGVVAAEPRLDDRQGRDAVQTPVLDDQGACRSREAQVHPVPHRNTRERRRGRGVIAALPQPGRVERGQERVSGPGRIDFGVARRERYRRMLAGPSAPKRISSPPSTPWVMSRSAPGRSSVHKARSGTSGATSWRLTPTRSARTRIGEGRGASWRTRSPARRSRRNPCHATATWASGGMTSAHSSCTSPATATTDQPGASVHAAGRTGIGNGTPGWTEVWTRPPGVSTLW